MSVEAWTYLTVGVTFAGYLYIGYLNRVKDTGGFMADRWHRPLAEWRQPFRHLPPAPGGPSEP
jgi:hypothetical protein